MSKSKITSTKKCTSVKHSVKKTKSSCPSTTGKISGPAEQKILSSLKELKVAGIAKVPRMTLVLFSGYKHERSTGYAKAMSALKASALIECSDKCVGLTAAGEAKVGLDDVRPPLNNEEVQARMKTVLKPKACEIFDLLADGNAKDRMEMATMTGYKNVRSTGFAEALSTLSTYGFIEKKAGGNGNQKSMIQLSDMVFPFGRPC